MTPAAVTAVPAERETGEEYRANDEHDAGDDRHPGSHLIKPIRPSPVHITGQMAVRMVMPGGRDGCSGGFLGCGHSPIMVARAH